MTAGDIASIILGVFMVTVLGGAVWLGARRP